MTSPGTTPPRRSLLYLVGMTSLMFGANFAWVSYNSILLLPLVQRVLPADRSSFAVGVVAFVGNLLGLATSLLVGVLSDHSASRWGKRTPSLLLGSLVGLPAIASAAVLHLSLPVIIASYVGMHLFTNIANGAWWPLLVDVIPDSQRGLASGLQGFQMVLASAVSFVATTYLNEVNRPDAALVLMAVVFSVSGVVCILTIRRDDRPATVARSLSLPEAVSRVFRVQTRVSVFFWLVFSALLVNMGLNSLQYFARDFLGIYYSLANPDAGLRLVGLVNLVVIMLAAVGSGLLSDRIGRRRLITAGALLSAVTTVLMALSRDFSVFLVLTVIRALATGPIMAVIPALASGLAPRPEAGQYMAYSNLTTALPSAVAPLLFGAMLNVGGASTPGSFVALLLVAAAFYLAGGVLFERRVSHKALATALQSAAPPLT